MERQSPNRRSCRSPADEIRSSLENERLGALAGGRLLDAEPGNIERRKYRHCLRGKSWKIRIDGNFRIWGKAESSVAAKLARDDWLVESAHSCSGITERSVTKSCLHRHLQSRVVRALGDHSWRRSTRVPIRLPKSYPPRWAGSMTSKRSSSDPYIRWLPGQNEFRHPPFDLTPRAEVPAPISGFHRRA